MTETIQFVFNGTFIIFTQTKKNTKITLLNVLQ